MLIEVEGLPCAGKTTQCEFLEAYFRSLRKGITVTVIDNAAITEFGVQLMKLLQSNTPRDCLTEMYSLLALESELYYRIMSLECALPNHIVIRDSGRGTLFSYLYATNTMVTLEHLWEHLETATNHIAPALSIFLDTPIGVVNRRNGNKRKQSRYDIASTQFLQRQRKVLQELCEVTPNWVTVNGNDTPLHVFDAIRARILDPVSV